MGEVPLYCGSQNENISLGFQHAVRLGALEDDLPATRKSWQKSTEIFGTNRPKDFAKVKPLGNLTILHVKNSTWAHTLDKDSMRVDLSRNFQPVEVACTGALDRIPLCHTQQYS